MDSLALYWHEVWLARIGTQAILLAILVWRGYHRRFPAFFLYTAWAVISGMDLWALDHRKIGGARYFYSYLVGSGVHAALGFAVLYELLRHTLRNYPVLQATGSSLYRWATLLLLFVGLALAWSALPPPESHGRLMTRVFLLQQSSLLLQCGLLAFLFLFAHSFGLSWRNRSFGIALGLGVTAMVSLVIAAIRVRVHAPTTNPASDVLNLISQLGDLTGVLIWSAYMLARESRPTTSIPRLPKTDLDDWNGELRRLVP